MVVCGRASGCVVLRNGVLCCVVLWYVVFRCVCCGVVLWRAMVRCDEVHRALYCLVMTRSLLCC